VGHAVGPNAVSGADGDTNAAVTLLEEYGQADAGDSPQHGRNP